MICGSPAAAQGHAAIRDMHGNIQVMQHHGRPDITPFRFAPRHSHNSKLVMQVDRTEWLNRLERITMPPLCLRPHQVVAGRPAMHPYTAWSSRQCRIHPASAAPRRSDPCPQSPAVRQSPANQQRFGPCPRWTMARKKRKRRHRIQSTAPDRPQTRPTQRYTRRQPSGFPAITAAAFAHGQAVFQ